MPGADGWRDVIRDGVTAKAAETAAARTGASHNIRLSRVGFSPEAHLQLVKAAKARGISLSGYIRRATLAHVALDLGVPAVDLFELDLGVVPIDGRGSKPTRDLDGERWGRWEVLADANSE